MAETKKTSARKAPAKSKSTRASDETSKAAQTDAARLEARSTERGRVRDAQRLDQGEQDRQAARQSIAEIRDESRKVLAEKRASA